MTLKVNATTFPDLLRSATFAANGDRYERQFPAALTQAFPTCQVLWAVFVVPCTKRMNSYPDALGADIRFRDSIQGEVQDIAAAHYSMTTHIANAHLKIDAKDDLSLEYLYVHLAAACDLAEAVMEKWFLLRLKCEDAESHTLGHLTLDEFLKIATEWYRASYSDFRRNYLERGKGPPIKLPARRDIIKEYLGDQPERKRYVNTAQEIRTVRNAIVHDVNLARIVGDDGRSYIPKASRISSYRRWRDVLSVHNDRQIVSDHFIEQYEQASQHLADLENALDAIWRNIVKEIETEFYSKERPRLRQSMDIEFEQSSDPFPVAIAREVSPATGYNPASGTYIGGSVDIYGEH